MEVQSPKMVTANLKEPDPQTINFDSFPLGYSFTEQGVVFRLFAPKADHVQLIVFDSYEHLTGEAFDMLKDANGIWNTLLPKDNLEGKWYAYSLQAANGFPYFEQTDRYIADPWSKHVTSRNHYLGFAKTKIFRPEPFDWQGDTFLAPEDPRDLIIYEAHIKDMVAHPSARTYVQGVYNDFWQAEVGGINHLKKLGVNAVEFLPLQKFSYFEPPYQQHCQSGLVNTWNPYSINHWGYMTSFYFAPETIYASDSDLIPGNTIGRSIKAINELKTLIRELHKAGIAVIMDVVYNHASQYDLNPLRYTAKDHYFRIDPNGHYLNDSWTGNDINTSNKYARALIVESIKYWISEFHIDGFRFDLAGLIDWETVDEITAEAQKLNPNVLLIAEPWGGEYKPDGYSQHGWQSWNDKLRNGFKGYDPLSDKGFIFGSWHHGCNRFALENFIRGTLKNNDHGLFESSRHAVNYLESHDGYTLGDFIRIALHPEHKERRFSSKEEITPLNKQEMAVAKLAALVLFVSQGVVMIHEGQEWARAKLIIDRSNIDPNAGKLDHDSYNKDNETNWLNYNEIACNQDLFEYYRGLIALRKQSPALRKAQPEDINFKVYNDPLHITFSISGESSSDPYDYFISLNGNPTTTYSIELPSGDWQMVANYSKCDIKGLRVVKNHYRLAASSGVIFRKLRMNAS